MNVNAREVEMASINKRGKTVLIGQEGVGKTCLLERFRSGKFHGHRQATIGAAFGCHSIIIDGVTVKLDIWDTAGQERFNSLLPMYIRDAQVVLICTDRANYNPQTIERYIQRALRQEPKARLALVITKSDLPFSSDDTNLSREKEFIGDFQLPVYYCSSKTGEGVDEIFYAAAEMIKDWDHHFPNDPEIITFEAEDFIDPSSAGWCC